MAEIGSATRAPGAMMASPFGWTCYRLGEHRFGAEAKPPQDDQGHQGGAGQEEARLDDLDPGRGLHAAERHIDDHQHADDDDRVQVVEAEEQFDELARTDHLRDEVEGDHHKRTDRGENADLGLVETEGGHVRERKLAEVPQPLGDQEENDRPADQEADRVDQTVEAAGEDEAGDAEEGRRRHVVAGDGEAVLKPGDAAARRIEVGGRLGLSGGPVGDPERAEHEEQEHDDRGPVQGLLLDGAEIWTRRKAPRENWHPTATRVATAMMSSRRHHMNSLVR